jgi:hypothetical protein
MTKLRQAKSFQSMFARSGQTLSQPGIWTNLINVKCFLRYKQDDGIKPLETTDWVSAKCVKPAR